MTSKEIVKYRKSRAGNLPHIADKARSEMIYGKMIIKYKDTPFSCGADIYFISANPLVKPAFRCPLWFSAKHIGSQYRSQGLASSYSDPKNYAIYITDRPLSKSRMVELITHECSHVVDYILEHCCITTVHTEVRAYLLDHIVGLCVQRIKL